MAMRFRRQKGDASDAKRWLEVDASMTGTLTFKDPVNLRINGQFEGTLDTKGTLLIGEQARVKATIRGETIMISGSVDGTVTATSRLELLQTANVSGKVSSPRVIMADGAILHGTLEMAGGRNTASPMSADELARYLEVDEATVVQWAKDGRLPARSDGDQWTFERSKVEEWLAREKVK